MKNTATPVSTLPAEIAAGDQLDLPTISRQCNTAPSTALRWILRGLPNAEGTRVRLEGVKRGRKWFTSRKALERFFGALPSSAPPSASIRTASSREAAAARAERALHDKYGI